MLTDLRKKKIIDELMYNTLIIDFADGTASITEDNITSESMKLKQSICDEDSLKFGGCIASEFSVEIFNTEDRNFNTQNLKNKWINVRIIQTAPTGEYIYPKSTLYPNTAYPNEIVADNEFYIFSGYIDNFERDKSDSNVFTLSAYDVLSKLHSKDGTTFLYNCLSSVANSTLKYIFDNILLKTTNKVMNIPYVISNGYFYEELPNGTTVGGMRVINNSWINGKDKITLGTILKNICEMLGVFGFIKPGSGGGYFTFIAPFGDHSIENYNFYEDFSLSGDTVNRYYGTISIANCSAYSTQKSYKPQDYTPNFLESKNFSDDNYDITDNVLAQSTFGTDTRLYNLFNGNSGKRITGYEKLTRSYDPMKATLDGRLWVNVGDEISIEKKLTDVNGDYIYETDDNGDYEIDENGNLIVTTVKYYTYVLSRNLTGIQALTDEIETKG